MDIPCICPLKDGQTRHEAGDTVNLHERLDFMGAMATQNAALIVLRDGGDEADILAAMAEKLCTYGIESWTVVDEHGKKVEPNRETVKRYLLADTSAAAIVYDAATDLYYEQVVRPLVDRVSNSSQPSPTHASTSARNGSEQKHPKPSKRSLTSTTLTDATEMTTSSLAGVSRS